MQMVNLFNPLEALQMTKLANEVLIIIKMMKDLLIILDMGDLKMTVKVKDILQIFQKMEDYQTMVMLVKEDLF